MHSISIDKIQQKFDIGDLWCRLRPFKWWSNDVNGVPLIILFQFVYKSRSISVPFYLT